MATLPSNVKHLYEQIISHIQRVFAAPSTPLDELLFTECGLVLAEPLANEKEALLKLINLLSEFLPSLQQDPGPPLRLLSKLVRPLSFEDVLSLQPPVDFVSGLSLAAAPYHELMVELLAKASKRGKDAAVLAGMPDVLMSLVDMWLCTGDIGVADMASQTIVRLLTVDQGETSAAVDTVDPPVSKAGQGQGLVWKRLFGDKDVYELIFARTTIRDVVSSLKHVQPRSGINITVSQVRLMEVMPYLGLLDWSYLTTSHHPEVEKRYGLPVPNSGLMEYVCSYMADFKKDVLVHKSLLDFFTKLVGCVRQMSPKNHNRSVSLEYLLDNGHHQRILGMLIGSSAIAEDGSIEDRLLLQPASQYMSQYVSSYKQDFLASDLVLPILQRVVSRLNISANRWNTGAFPVDDLLIVASLPRIILLPHRTISAGFRKSILLSIPASTSNCSALNALATIFSGRLSNRQGEELLVPKHAPNQSEEETFWNDPVQVADAAAAGAAYLCYLKAEPDLFPKLTATANIAALPDSAIAAITLMKSILTAQWAPLQQTLSQNLNDLPTSFQDLPAPQQLPFPAKWHDFMFPTPHTSLSNKLAGIRSLFLTDTLNFSTWLRHPPSRFSGLVGAAAREDHDDAAYRVAMAKFDLLKVMTAKLKLLHEHTSDTMLSLAGDLFRPMVKYLLDELEARQRLGVWGEVQVENRIAIMEM